MLRPSRKRKEKDLLIGRLNIEIIRQKQRPKGQFSASGHARSWLSVVPSRSSSKAKVRRYASPPTNVDEYKNKELTKFAFCKRRILAPPSKTEGRAPGRQGNGEIRLKHATQLYCQRSATAGSTRSARHAGMAAEARVTSVVNAAATAYTCASTGPTPTSIAATTRASDAAASEPTTRPATANANPCRITSRIMSFGCAPSVTRIPISPVRCATAYAMTLYRPIAASSRPNALNTLKRLAATLAPNSDAETYSVMGSASKMVSSGSRAVASRRSAAIASLTGPEVRTLNVTPYSGRKICRMGI